MAKKELVKRRKQDLQDRYTIRIQGGKSGLVEATSKMDIHEFRVFATMLTMVLPEDEDFTTYELRVQDIIKLFSLKKDGRYYELMREAAQRLLDRKFMIFEMRNGVEYMTTIHLIAETSEPVNKVNKNHILLQFSPKLKPYLLQLKKEYLTIDIRNIQDISSPYSVKLYLVLKHQQRLGNAKVRYTVERIKKILAIDDGEYVLYGSFKQQVIQRAINDIEKYTDLSVGQIEEEKEGRSVCAVIFHITEKKIQREQELIIKKQVPGIVKKPDGSVVLEQSKALEATSIEDVEIKETNDGKEEDQITTIFRKVKNYKIAKSTVRNWIREFPMEQIQLGIDYVLNEVNAGKKIKNIGGYINQMVSSPSLLEISQEQKAEQKRKFSHQQDKLQREQSVKKQIDELRLKSHEMKLSILLSLIGDKEIKQTLIDKFSIGLFKNYYKSHLSFEENLKSSAVVGFMISTASQLFPTMFEAAEVLIKEAEDLEKNL